MFFESFAQKQLARKGREYDRIKRQMQAEIDRLQGLLGKRRQPMPDGDENNKGGDQGE